MLDVEKEECRTNNQKNMCSMWKMMRGEYTSSKENYNNSESLPKIMVRIKKGGLEISGIIWRRKTIIQKTKRNQ